MEPKAPSKKDFKDFDFKRFKPKIINTLYYVIYYFINIANRYVYIIITITKKGVHYVNPEIPF